MIKKGLVYSSIFIGAGVLVLALTGYNMGFSHPSSKADLQKYILIPENGLNRVKQLGDVELSLSYRPFDLVNETEGKRVGSVHKDKLYFIFNISKNEMEYTEQYLNTPNYQKVNNLFAFGLGDYVTLKTDDGQTFSALDCNYTPTYGMGKSNKIALTFPKNKSITESDYFHVRIKDFGIGIGHQKFKFYSKDIDRISSLITDKKISL